MIADIDHAESFVLHRSIRKSVLWSLRIAKFCTMNIYIERAELLMKQSRFELAEEQLRMALAEDSADSNAHGLLSLCLLNRDQYDDATAEAKQAIHISPDAAIGFYALAATMRERNRLKEAHHAVSEAVRIEPWNSMHFALLAAIEMDRSRWKEALEAANQGLEFDPDDVQCTNLRAMALVKLGRRTEAGQSIDAALVNDPDNAMTHANQGWTQLHRSEPKKAAEHFREALRLDPTMEWARLGIIEAMKARNPVYRYMLAFFLWMGRLSPRVQIAMVLGLVFGNRILASICASVPMLAPFATPIQIGYILFAWMTWTSSALFDLVLCLDRFGRLVLNRSEKQCAGLVGLCILMAALVSLFGELRYEASHLYLWTDGLLFLGIAIPVSATFRSEGNRRLLMLAYSCGLLMAILYTLFLDVRIRDLASAFASGQKMTAIEESTLSRYVGEYVYWFQNCITGIAISTWLGLGMSIVPNRK
jgi:tetratricopeptide (TPR) repeat protein